MSEPNQHRRAACLLYHQMASASLVIQELQLETDWTEEDAQAITCSMLFESPLAEMFPLPKNYQKGVVTALVSALEKDAEEVTEPLMRKLNATLIGPSIGEDCAYVTFTLPAPDWTFGVDHQFCVGIAPHENEVGLRIWEAGVVLGEYLHVHPDLTEGREILELGAGCGLLGLLLRHCSQATKIVLTDSQSEVLQMLRHNIEANAEVEQILRVRQENETVADFPDIPIEVAELDWTRPETYTESLGHIQKGQKKLLLAADCIYDPAGLQAFIDVLACALKSAGDNGKDDSMRVLVASTIRDPRTYEAFLAKLVATGLEMHMLTPAVSEKDNSLTALTTGRTPFYCPNRAAVRLAEIKLHKKQSGARVLGQSRLPLLQPICDADKAA